MGGLLRITRPHILDHYWGTTHYAGDVLEESEGGYREAARTRRVAGRLS
jgi:hypothetical protein